jgi:hypothetical protein
MSNFVFDRIHIHDTANSNNGSGTHGFYVDSAKNITITRIRSERHSDDSVGGQHVTGTAGNDPGSMTWRHIIATEAVDSTDNSQQCFELVTARNGVDSDGQAELITHANGTVVSDVLVAGCYLDALRVLLAGTSLDRIVVGGIVGSAGNYPVTIEWATGGTNAGLSASLATEYPQIIKDSVLGVFTESSNAVNAAPLSADVRNSLMVGSASLASGITEIIRYLHTAQESVFDVGLTDDSDGMLSGISSGSNVAPLSPASFNYTDSVFRSGGDDRCCKNFGDDLTFNWTRSIFMGGAEIGDGPFISIVGDANGNAAVNIDGGIFTYSTPGANNLLQDGGNTPLATVTQNICYTTTVEVPATAFPEGAGASATTLIVDDIEPIETTTSTRLSAITYNPNIGSHPCNDARPRYLGLRNFGVTHALLGDFVIEQNDRWSTADPPLIGVVRGGSAGTGGAY